LRRGHSRPSARRARAILSPARLPRAGCMCGDGEGGLGVGRRRVVDRTVLTACV
jgi:hypothetical protein